MLILQITIGNLQKKGAISEGILAITAGNFCNWSANLMSRKLGENAANQGRVTSDRRSLYRG
jgi:hypothetical protein